MRVTPQRFWRDLSLSTVSAGFVAVLVGITSTIALVFQAAQSLGASPEQMASWIWALGLGMGLATLLPSLWWRMPVMVAWSTPGAAVLATAAAQSGFTLPQAVGAFIASAALVMLCGATGWFERAMRFIPMPLASALLAGVLARFGLSAVGSVSSAPVLVLLMVGAYLAGRRWLPRYAIPLALLSAMLFVAAQAMLAGSAGQNGLQNWSAGLAWPVWVTPQWSWHAMVSMALPLFVVTMASQNLPGVATIRATGFEDKRAQGGEAGIPVSPMITVTGLTTLLLAPFGCFSLSLSAITAAICMGPEAHSDRLRRYTASAMCGFFYITVGLFGGAVISLLLVLPKELVATIAGLALLGTIANALQMALADEHRREAAIITFLVTLSGVVVAGVGSAFWGIVAGLVALGVSRLHRT
ncbi:benzoate/H(+) symporter BenE family transporter [Curvibacter sp. CHRR-16]|uniref:benzoate/H(+) symporter BenE family transporter n=1 Tax=Curvibacter sp. CHRR-16 TaxID=2835872 RepID=UPI001BDA77D8|nr:benzoate/H(+) symporter BenE family transporter [Curvibacter sp. CHRR-16]MBT0570489.1 benzoate/H(+) symporter BenE family transporter [Curvibacter sp. CHRR-16]